MDHFEARQYQAISRHLLISCVSHLFLAEFQQTQGKKSDADDQPTVDRSIEPGTAVAAWGRCSRARAQAISAQLTLTQQRNAKADRSYRKRKLHKLHELGIKLKDLCRCRRDSS